MFFLLDMYIFEALLNFFELLDTFLPLLYFSLSILFILDFIALY